MSTATKTAIKTETEKLFALDKPSLENLSYALRHPETWPQDFEWDYRQCNHCAMGLAHALWSGMPAGKNDRRKGASRMARAFAISYEAAANIFFGSHDWCPTKVETKGWLWWRESQQQVDMKAVTPGMAADQIDKHISDSRRA